MSDVLAKPIAPELLYRTLERLLPTSPRPQYVDPDVLRNLTNDPAKSARFAQKFVEVLTVSLKVIRDATENANLDALAREAHSLKSSAMMVGAQGFGEQCAALERAALDRDLPGAVALLESLTPVARGVSEELALVFQLPPSTS
jgi:HPt (histidine-containing phosphotransfer) domain-containing protein